MLLLRFLPSIHFFVFVVAFWLRIFSNEVTLLDGDIIGLPSSPIHLTTPQHSRQATLYEVDQSPSTEIVYRSQRIGSKSHLCQIGFHARAEQDNPKQFDDNGNDPVCYHKTLCKTWAMVPHIKAAHAANTEVSGITDQFFSRKSKQARLNLCNQLYQYYQNFRFSMDGMQTRQLLLLAGAFPPTVIESITSSLVGLFRHQMTRIDCAAFKARLTSLLNTSSTNQWWFIAKRLSYHYGFHIKFAFLKLYITYCQWKNCCRGILFLNCKWLNSQMLCDIQIDFSPTNIIPFESQRMTIDPLHICGGHSAICVSGANLRPHVISAPLFSDDAQFRYVGNVGGSEVQYNQSTDLLCRISLRDLSPFIAYDNLRNECRNHFVVTKVLSSRKALCKYLQTHRCLRCESDVFCFRIVSGPHILNANSKTGCVNPPTAMDDVALISEKLRNTEFPPIPRSKNLMEDIVNQFCHGLQPHQFEEEGCKVCGRLTLKSNLKDAHGIRSNLSILSRPDMTKVEQSKPNAHVKQTSTPILAENCSLVCKECYTALADGEMPKHALANGLWIGPVPNELQDLTWMEQMCISRVRHNYCVARLAKGSTKLIANAVMFANPTAELYQSLPPPIEELDDIIAVIFTGPCEPQPMDLRRSPFFVRNRKIYDALQWLKLNHDDYSDLDMTVTEATLKKYPIEGIPIAMEYEISDSNKISEATGLDDKDDEDGTVAGPCPFRVHGLTETRFRNMGHKEMKLEAMQYLKEGGKMLGIEHCEEMESIYNNPQLYPKMFPWLFPYGRGGIGSKAPEELSYVDHIRHLLLYHDKRFQTDPEFPLIIFNHYNIKSCTTGSHLLVKDKRFVEVTNRLLSLNPTALDDLSQKFKKKESSHIPFTEDEKECYQLLNDLNLLAWRVDGSITNKKNQRSEINALIDHWGCPSWYITIAPADIKHPVCIYYADNSGKHVFAPDLHSLSARAKLVIDNPVAHARFFHYFVQLFLREILGIDSEKEGWFGEPVAHYATVEQQGRMALHLHMLLWLKGAYSPVEIREKLLNPLDDFSTKLIAYLESCFAGEFMTGNQSQVSAMVDSIDQSMQSTETPIHTLPTAPDDNDCECGMCHICDSKENWWEKYRREVDYILYISQMCMIMNSDFLKEIKGKVC